MCQVPYLTLRTQCEVKSLSQDSRGKNTGVGCCFLLQGIFPTQGSNPGHQQADALRLYGLSHEGSPRTQW